MKVKNYKDKKYKKAFTLVEALIAISILMIAIASPMIITQKGLLDAELSKNEMTASFLAQDGIEAVKNIRDNVALNAANGTAENSWLSDLSGCICTIGASCNDPSNSAHCNIDTTQQNLANAIYTSNSANPLEIERDASNNFTDFILGAPAYGYSVKNSIFSRYINIATTINPDEAKINVEVKWNEASGPQSVTLSGFIYNYSPYIQQ